MISKNARPLFLLLGLLLAALVFSFACGNPEGIQEQAAPSLVDDQNAKTIDPNSEKQQNPGSFVSAFEDRQGRIWFGSQHGGIYRYDHASQKKGKQPVFEHFDSSDGFAEGEIRVITEDMEGHVWFGTGSGLANWDGRQFNDVAIPQQDTTGAFFEDTYPIVNPNRVTALHQDKTGRFWIGTDGGGAFRYDCASFTPILRHAGRVQPDGEHHNPILNIMEDASGNLWFSSMSQAGIYMLKGASAQLEDGKALVDHTQEVHWKYYGKEEGLAVLGSTSTLQDSQGRIWATLRGGGIHVYDPTLDRFSAVEAAVEPCERTSINPLEDRNGNIWFGSMLGNVCVYTPSSDPQQMGVFETFTDKEGQALVGIRHILEDNRGHLWFCGKDSQIWRYDGEQLEDFRPLMKHVRN